jgi:hypothetical protein
MQAAVWIGVLLLLPRLAFAQPAAVARPTAPPEGTAVIRGRVLASDTGKPLTKALVRVALGVNQDRTVTTDERGIFELARLPAGRFTVFASKAGYVPIAYGQQNPRQTARPVELRDKQILENIDVTLPRGGVIVARITDDFGDPIQGIGVQAEQIRFVQGERVPTSAGGGIGFPFAMTNDRGEQRLIDLLPGEYYVSAGKSLGGASLGADPSGRMFVATYYPGTPTFSEAQRVLVSPGQETLVEFNLTTAKAHRIRGIVRASDGRIPANPRLSVQMPEGGNRGLSINGDGSFVIDDLVSGEHLITVAPPPGMAGGFDEYATVPVTIGDGDITGLVITTMKPGSATGRLVFDTGAPPDTLRPGAVALFTRTLAEGPLLVPRTTWGADWTFEITLLNGDRTIGLGAQSSGWYLRSVTQQGRYVTDVPLNFDNGTRRRTEVAGRATDSKNQPVLDYVAVLFADDEKRWGRQSRYIGTARSDQDGQFRLTGLPTGIYRAAALDVLETGEERDPELLQAIRNAATLIELSEDQPQSLTLRLLENQR